MIDDVDYEVGYKKPPVSYRFKKGQSGNRRGRPMGSQNYTAIFWKLARKKIVVIENGKQVTLSTLEVVIHQMMRKAAAGDDRARNDVFRCMMLWAADESGQGKTVDPALRHEVLSDFIRRAKSVTSEAVNEDDHDNHESERPLNVIPDAW